MTSTFENFPTGPTCYRPIELDDSAYEQFLQRGRWESESLITPFSVWRDEKPARHWVIAILADSYNYLYEDNRGEATLDQFLAGAYLAELDLRGPPTLLRRNAKPLLQLLPEIAAHHAANCMEIPFDELKKVHPLLHVDEPTQTRILAEGGISGRISLCGCLIPDCNSQYAWIRQDTCLFSLSISGAGDEFMELFPFRIKRNQGNVSTS